ncbi:hypothetical protein [Phaeocystidibacter luteus]|uniref:ABM domain-containing protein n=1 Tax=Phaeocystidibacter luteus TaxID=911197 RepID=A0A6N6RFI6_9FLAO|nr:hypothetical protein [Phaeocystidibacter luteus]KAB2807305.1 hypothetical protein F8C67_12050 [Phaeocystidibacter luteus]
MKDTNIPIFELTEYRLKPMFRDDFRVTWRNLYGQLKRDQLIGKAELYSVEPSRFMSLVEWKGSNHILEEQPYLALANEMMEVLDRVKVVSPLQQLESTK